MSTLKGRTLFISGASRGIGLAIAKRAARDGANIAIAAKTTDPHPKLIGSAAQIALNRNCAPQGRDRASEFSQKAVTRGLDQTSVLFGKARLDYLTPQLANARIGSLLVALHQG